MNHLASHPYAQFSGRDSVVWPLIQLVQVPSEGFVASPWGSHPSRSDPSMCSTFPQSSFDKACHLGHLPARLSAFKAMSSAFQARLSAFQPISHLGFVRPDYLFVRPSAICLPSNICNLICIILPDQIRNPA